MTRASATQTDPGQHRMRPKALDPEPIVALPMASLCRLCQYAKETNGLRTPQMPSRLEWPASHSITAGPEDSVR